ncbi:MAG: hypothetical protein L6R36_002858 [Xanthoria steineri]|nr:MAG: hypothetical protein L6R36_002858 [Xanthoria steineri]
MVGVRSMTLLAMLAAAVVSSPTNLKRQTPTDIVVFRSDLREGEGQSPRFKNLLLSIKTTANSSEITFVNMNEKDQAAGGRIESKGITLTTNTTGTIVTKVLDIGQSAGNPSAPQPVVLVDEPNDLGFFYTSQNELKLGSTTPQWDSWVICPGTSHPTLSWLGVVPTADGRGLVTPPRDCSIVRLFAESFQSIQNGVQSTCG